MGSEARGFDGFVTAGRLRNCRSAPTSAPAVGVTREDAPRSQGPEAAFARSINVERDAGATLSTATSRSVVRSMRSLVSPQRSTTTTSKSPSPSPVPTARASRAWRSSSMPSSDLRATRPSLGRGVPRAHRPSGARHPVRPSTAQGRSAWLHSAIATAQREPITATVVRALFMGLSATNRQAAARTLAGRSCTKGNGRRLHFRPELVAAGHTGNPAGRDRSRSDRPGASC